MLKVDDIRVTYLKSANTSGLSNFVEIAQPDTGVIGGYAFSEYVTDQGDGTWVTPGGTIYTRGSDNVLRSKGAEDLYIR